MVVVVIYLVATNSDLHFIMLEVGIPEVAVMAKMQRIIYVQTLHKQRRCSLDQMGIGHVIRILQLQNVHHDCMFVDLSICNMIYLYENYFFSYIYNILNSKFILSEF